MDMKLIGENYMDVINIYNKKVVTDCLSCDLISGKILIPGGSIFESNYFDAQQDFEVPIPGFVIIVSKRHIKSIDDFTPEESSDFIDFILKIRKSLREALNIENVYLVQEEDTEHHFHVWLFPVSAEFISKYGKGIENVKAYMKYVRTELNTKENLSLVEESVIKLREYLNSKF